MRSVLKKIRAGVILLGWFMVMASGLLLAETSEKSVPSLRLQPYAPNQLLLQFKTSFKLPTLQLKTSTGNVQLDSLNSLFQLKEIVPLCSVIKNTSSTNNKASTAQIFLFKFANVSSLSKLKKSYEALEVVELVEFNYFYFAEYPTSINTSSLLQLQLEEAARFLDCQRSVIIGIIDTGIDWQRENLKRKIWQNRLEKPDGKDNDANGLVDDIWGWNFVDKDWMNPLNLSWESRPVDYSGHGTQIAEIISQLCNYRASNKDNDTKNKIMILKAGELTPNGKPVFTAFAMAQAILYAADHGARIINISCNSENFSQVLQQAIDYAAKKNCVIIAAAGDKNSNQPHYPAASENVWAITATDDNDKKLDESNYGSWIDLTAPGSFKQNFFLADSSQLQLSGSAIAAANVSGLAGLLLSCQDIVDNDSLKRRILWSSENIYPENPRFSGKLGAGRINVLRAINSQHQPNITIRKFSYYLKNNVPHLFAFNVVPVQISIKNLSSVAQNVNIKLTTDDPYLSITKSEITLSELSFNQEFTDESDPFAFVVNNDYPAGHKTNLSLRITTSNGFSLEQSFVFGNRNIQPKDLALIDQNSAHLKWTGDAALIGYHIYRKKDEEQSYNRINTLPVLDSTFIDQTIQRGVRYFYYVTGLDPFGWESPPSEAVSIKLKKEPRFLFYPIQDTVISNQDSIRFAALPQVDSAENYTYQWRVNGKAAFDDSSHWFIDSYKFQNKTSDTVVVTIIDVESDTAIPHQWVLSLKNIIKKLNIRSVFPASDTTLSIGDSLIFRLGLQHRNDDSLIYRWRINDKIIEHATDSLFVLWADSLSETKNLVKVTAINNDTTLSYSWNIFIKPSRSAFKRWFFFPQSDTTISASDSLLISIDPDVSNKDSLSYRWFVNQLLDTTAVGSFYIFFKSKASFDPDTIAAQMSERDTSNYHRWIIHYFKNQNRAPQIIKCSPPNDSALTKADSLLFRIHCKDLDGDSLRFYWSLNGGIDTTTHDSAYCYRILNASLMSDTLTVVVADDDTSITLEWIIRTGNFVPTPTSMASIDWFPESDSIMAQGDSLIFLVRNANDSCRFQWQINSQIDSTAHDSVFLYRLTQDSIAIDTIQVDVFDSDSLFSHQWYIHYFKLKQQRSPVQLAFKPKQNVITSVDDSLKFSVQILEGDFAELTFQWSVNNQRDTTAVDTILYYHAEHFPAVPDTIQLVVSRDDTTISHQWIVEFHRQQTLPIPLLIFPIKGNRICEDDKLAWENDSLLAKEAANNNWKYIVQLSKDSTFSQTVASDTCPTTSIKLKDLSRFDLITIGKPSYWRVKIFSGDDKSSDFSKCNFPFYYYPQFTQLVGFSGQKNTDGTIDLFWTTDYEANCAGFNVYRSETQNDRFEKVNGSLITGKTNYTFQDGGTQAGKTYFYKLEDVSLNGKRKFHTTISVTTPKPDKFSLWQNYPNPFNTLTSIKYELPTAANVKIIVCNVLGRQVKTLVDENKEAGFYTVYWDGIDDQGENVVSGIYFYTLLTLADKLTRKMIVVR